MNKYREWAWFNGLTAEVPCGIAVLAIIITAIVVTVFAGEPIEKAPDEFYDMALVNMMQLANVPDKEIMYLLSLPTSPEVDLETMTIQDTTAWFFVTSDLRVGMVFQLQGQCKTIRPDFVYDLRGKKSK